MFVAAAIALGVFALRTAASANSLRHDVSSLRAELGGLQSRLAAEQRALVKTQKKLTALRGTSAKAASAGSVQRLSDTVDHLGVTVHMFEVCVPQLERELAGLRLVTGSVNGWLTNARLLAPAALSPACASALGR